MNTSKIIKGVAGGGRYTVTAPIIKEDYGLYLQIEGIELPETYEVDFSNEEHSGSSVTMIGNADGVLIPSQFISSGKDIFAFLYHVGEDYGRTIFKFRIPNKVRPDRTNEQPTPEEQSVIDQAINALNNAVEQTSQDVETTAHYEETTGINADLAERSAENAQSYASSANTSSDAAYRSASSAQLFASQAETSARTASEKADSITGLTATAQTLPSGSSASASYDAQTGVLNLGIPKGKDGTNGTDGTSPTANVSKTGKVATITITDKTGTTSAQVEDGTDGQDGISPTVTITPITGGHRITITDKDGEHSADVMDGTGNVDDVQINGTSIVSDGVANVPIASPNNAGVVRYASDYGIEVLSDGRMRTTLPSESQFKSGNGTYRAVTTMNQHKSVFYGLAKSAGDTTQSASSNAVGSYTDEAKAKIKKMIGANDEFELIRCITLEEDSQTVIIDTDESSSPFSLQGFMIAIVSLAATGATAEGYLKIALNSTLHSTNRIFDIGAGIRKTSAYKNIAIIGTALKGIGHSVIETAQDSGGYLVDENGTLNRSVYSSGSNTAIAFSNQQVVNSVFVGTDNASLKLGAGSIIALYGIRA